MIDKPHVLVIHEGGHDPDWDIEHPEGCPTEVFVWNGEECVQPTCLTQFKATYSWSGSWYDDPDGEFWIERADEG